MKRRLYIITQDFPYGNAETSFLKPEIDLLQKEFEITIVATELKGTEKKRNVEFEVIELYNSDAIFYKLESFLMFFLKVEAWKEALLIIKERKYVIRRLLRMFMYGTYAETFWRKLKKNGHFKKNMDSLFYFYWWDYKCLGATMNRKRYPYIQIIARTHNYDLYDERELYGRQFFKKQMDNKLDRLIFIADFGKKYYLNNNKLEDSFKYPLCRLGVPEQKKKNKQKNHRFVLLSCSNVIPVKRVGLIIKGLALLSEAEVKWIHIGGGSEFDYISGMAKQLLDCKGNISYELKGSMENDEVIAYYQENDISCFITTTSIEGNPVSVQEALSFGLPIIGTAVSDIPLMIEGNGVLLAQDPDPEEVAKAVLQVYLADEGQKIMMSEKSLELWERDYNADKNYKNFLNEILNV